MIGRELQGDTSQASELLKQASTVLRQRDRSGDSKQALAINKCGNAFYKDGRDVEAEDAYWSALNGYENAKGPDHAHTLQMLGNLSRTIRKLGREQEANVLKRRSGRYGL